jgi:hypothetical protein
MKCNKTKPDLNDLKSGNVKLYCDDQEITKDRYICYSEVDLNSEVCIFDPKQSTSLQSYEVIRKERLTYKIKECLKDVEPFKTYTQHPSFQGWF